MREYAAEENTLPTIERGEEDFKDGPVVLLLFHLLLSVILLVERLEGLVPANNAHVLCAFITGVADLTIDAGTLPQRVLLANSVNTDRRVINHKAVVFFLWGYINQIATTHLNTLYPLLRQIQRSGRMGLVLVHHAFHIFKRVQKILLGQSLSDFA